ncbi:MAG: alpha/beta hydrolase [Humibacter sp.]
MEMQPGVMPIPDFLSERARSALSVMLWQDSALPPTDDKEAWQEVVEKADEAIAPLFAPFDAAPVDSTQRIVNGVPTYIMSPHGVTDTDSDPVVLDFHGGALTQCKGDLARLMSVPNVLRTGLTHWVPDYRMPPAHPYPAALDDAVAVYRALVDARGADRITVWGGSAGGNIAAALMLRIKAEGLPMPRALMLLTPEVDLTESGDSFHTLAAVSNTLGSLGAQNRLYANGRDLSDPFLSPLFGDVAGFPPTFLQAGGRDLFLSNTIRMHRKLRSAGVEAELHVFEAMPHGGFGGAPEDEELDTEIRRFVNARIQGTSS